jgi:FkbM family methyltransferase
MSLRIVLQSVLNNPGNSGQLGRKLCAAVGWQIVKRLSPRPRILTLANGTRFWAYPDCVVSSALHYSDWPEYHELQFCRRLVRPGQVVFDVGANVGHLSLLLADIIGPEQVVAFEPTPVTFRRLVENFRLNNWPISNLCHVAVGRTCGRIEMPDLAHPVTTNSPLVAAGAVRKVEVPLVSLNSLVSEYRGRDVGLLKVDVEGFEPEVFAGADEFLRVVAPRLVMFESLGGHPDPAVEQTLTAAGYRLFQLDAKGLPVLGGLRAQNLFAARPDVFGSLLGSGPSDGSTSSGPLGGTR